jgi:hypothetical protein
MSRKSTETSHAEAQKNEDKALFLPQLNKKYEEKRSGVEAAQQRIRESE